MADTADYQRHSQRSGSSFALFWIATIGIALVVLIVFAVPILLDEAGINRNGGLSVAEVVDNPQQYAGQTIALQAEVEQTVGSRGLTLDGPGVISDEMLVVSRQPLEPVGGSAAEERMFQTNDEVLVSGTVRQFEREELERELGVSLDDEQFAEYEGRYIFVADTVTPIDD